MPKHPRDPIPGQPDWETLEAALAQQPPGQRIPRLDQATIQLFSDADATDPISAAIPQRKWIAFEVERDGSTFVLYDGRWFRVDTDYGALVHTRVQQLFDQSHDWDLPPWGPGNAGHVHEEEQDYNRRLAAHLGGIYLDRTLIRTAAHPRGIEGCDVYLPDSTLVHVKRTDTSAPASHLLAQALVSALAISNDVEARGALRDHIAGAGGDPASLNRRPARMLLVFARPGGPPITADTLFTFTRVTLLRLADQLGGMGVEVEVASTC